MPPSTPQAPSVGCEHRLLLGRAKRAQTWDNAHRDAWSAKYAELTKLAPDVAHDMFQHYAPVYVAIDDRVETVQQELADAFFEAGVIGKRIDVRAIFDKRFNALLGAQTP